MNGTPSVGRPGRPKRLCRGAERFGRDIHRHRPPSRYAAPFQACKQEVAVNPGTQPAVLRLPGHRPVARRAAARYGGAGHAFCLVHACRRRAHDQRQHHHRREFHGRLRATAPACPDVAGLTGRRRTLLAQHQRRNTGIHLASPAGRPWPELNTSRSSRAAATGSQATAAEQSAHPGPARYDHRPSTLSTSA